MDPSRIDTLYDDTLKPRLDSLESLRVSVRGYIVKALALVLVPMSFFWLSDLLDLGDLGGMGAKFLAFFLVVIGVGIAGMKYALPGFTAFANYRMKFKREVVSEIFKAVCPGTSYDALQGIAKQDFDAAGLFNERGSFVTDDRVRGVIGQTPFEAAEVRRAYSTGGKNSTTYVVFHGLFFHLDFNKSLRGVTIVQPETAEAYTIGPRDGLTTVTLENPEFERQFAVYASDEVEARYVLTPRMMEQILALAASAGKPIFLAFKGARAYLGVHYGRALFEPGIAATTSREAVREMAAHFALAETVVRELDLNTRIWTKDVDDSLLKRRDVEPDGLLAEAIAKGGLTEADLWKTATASVEGLSTEDDGSVIERPAATRIEIEPAGAGIAVRYPIGVGFMTAVAIWALSVAVLVAALHALPEDLDVGLGPLEAPLRAVPAVPVVQSYVNHLPIVWLFGACVVGSAFALGWMLRVRRVEIAPDAVRVWRGLRPFPRTYARPEYGKVVRIEHSVHVGKIEGVNLVNPTASPTISEDESRWVAAEMRRALRATRT